jgi:hypothetical protein
MYRRWFLFLVCLAGGVPFFNKRTNLQSDCLIVRIFTSLLSTAEASLTNPNHLQNVSENSLHIAPTTRRISTPRPRSQFPGFLLLHPQLTTDKGGQSHTNFRPDAHARNGYAMSFAEDGKIGVAATDFLALVPFLAEFALISAASVSGTTLCP